MGGIGSVEVGGRGSVAKKRAAEECPEEPQEIIDGVGVRGLYWSPHLAQSYNRKALLHLLCQLLGLL